MDTIGRTLAKTVSWRVSATTLTIIIALIATGSITLAVGIGGTEAVVKMIAYALHERLWGKISWGIKQNSLDKEPSN